MQTNNPFYRRLRFVLSLPERTVRALAAVASGTTSLLTEMLLPDSLRGTRTYQISLGMMQTYIIERIAQMESEVAPDAEPLAGDYLPRKMVGTVLETAGLFSVGASPLWLFAVLGDAIGGSRVYLDRLVGHLKTQGLLSPEAEFRRLEDVLEAAQRASLNTAALIDMPPLSREALRSVAGELRSHYRETFEKSIDLLPRLEALWAMIEKASAGDEKRFNRILGMMAVDAVGIGRKGGKGALVVGKTGLQLFDERVLESYRRTLAAVVQHGLMAYLDSHYRPYLKAARRHYDSSRRTWTDSLL